MKIRTFSELTVWQRSHKLTLLIYKLTAEFPRSERFGFVSQLRRSSASVPANIAQGFGRRTTRELLRSLQIASGELEETRYFLILSRDLGYVPELAFNRSREMCESVGQVISALGRALKKRIAMP